MQRIFTLETLAQLWRHFCQRFVLINETGITALRGNGNAVQDGSRRRIFAKTPVGVPSLGKDGSLLIGTTAQLDDVVSTLNGRQIWIAGKIPHQQAEALQIVVTNVLFGKHHHVMLQPSLAYRLNRFCAQLLRQVYTFDQRTTGAISGSYGNCILCHGFQPLFYCYE